MTERLLSYFWIKSLGGLFLAASCLLWCGRRGQSIAGSFPPSGREAFIEGVYTAFLINLDDFPHPLHLQFPGGSSFAV